MALQVKLGEGFWKPGQAGLTGTTDTTDVQAIIPQVMADSIAQKMGKLIRFAPLAMVDTRLVGSAGSSITLPTWAYIGDANIVDEGGTVTREEIKASSKSFVIHKIAKDIQVTDEAEGATNGAVLNEIDGQLAVSIAQTVDKSVVEVLRAGATANEINKKTVELTQAGLAQLRVAFGEDIEDTVLVIASVDYGKILAMKEFVAVLQGQAFMAGHVGHVMGLNIVISDRLNENESFLVRAGGLAISYKRQVHFEVERLAQQRSNAYCADLHYVTYIRDASKLQGVTFKEATAPEEGK